MEESDYLHYGPTDPLLFKWATSILNEVVLWDKLRDKSYVFTSRDREAYNIIKQWNPYLKSLENNEAIALYIEDVAVGDEEEAARISTKFENSNKVDHWIEARLDNIAQPPPLSEIDEYFFISEHNVLLNNNILRLGKMNFSLPMYDELYDRQTMPPNWFQSPITGRTGLLQF